MRFPIPRPTPASLRTAASRRTAASLLLATLLLPVACGPAEEPLLEDPAAEACEHAAGGPFVDLTAGAAADATAPEVAADHRAYRVALTTGGTGWVRFAADAAGDHHVFLSHDVPVTVQDDLGAAVALEATEAVDACDEVAVVNAVELGVGTHHLGFGPVAEDQVLTVIVEEADHEHSHDE